MIYKQKVNVCFGCALGGILQKVGRRASLEEIEAFYKEAALDPKKGVTGKAFLEKAKTMDSPLKIKDYQMAWCKDGNIHNLPLLKLWAKLQNGNFLVTLRTRKTKFILDTQYMIVPNGSPQVGLHTVALRQLAVVTKRLVLQNSWGEEWGLGGFFGINLKDILTEVEEIWEVIL